MLSNWGMKPKSVHGGEQALHELRLAVEKGNPYALVLLDSMMPGMDGFTLAEKIRKDPVLAATVILMVSSTDSAGASESCRTGRELVCLTKPIIESELWRGIAEVLCLQSDEMGDPSAVSSAMPQEPGRRLHVLLAEDNPINQRVAVTLLEERGHTVVLTNNGKEALEAFSKDAFDIVLMDVEMPEMDGLQPRPRFDNWKSHPEPTRPS